MPPKIPDGAREMNQEFARRLESFLTGGQWFDLVQKVRGERGDGRLWEFMLAGIATKLSDDDNRFAEAIDWTLTRDRLRLTNVTTYDVANWWYLAAQTTETNIWGWVDVKLMQGITQSEAEQRAKDFASIVLDRAQTGPTLSATATAKNDASGGTNTEWEVEGTATIS